MFTKSGSKLVRISIPSKNDKLPSNGDTIKQQHQANGHIDSILDDLVSRGCTVTTITTEQTKKQKRNCINSTPVNNSRRSSSKSTSLSQIPAAQNCISPNDVLTSQRKPEFANVQRKNERTTKTGHSRAARNRSDDDILREKDRPPDTIIQNLPFDKQEETPPAGPSPDLGFMAGKQDSNSNVNYIRYINGTKYVCFTPQTNVIKRERLIQANENEINKTIETAVQCDLFEDESSSSDSSQSDWINEIIEEYEYLEEDGDMFECHVCGEVCRSHLSNLKHSQTHRESSLLCFRCGRLFPNTSKLLAHEEKMHAEDSLKIKKALRCPKLNCLKAFHSERQLFDHIDQHTSRVTEQRCNKCQRSFPSSLQLLSHVNRRNCFR